MNRLERLLEILSVRHTPDKGVSHWSKGVSEMQKTSIDAPIEISGATLVRGGEHNSEFVIESIRVSKSEYKQLGRPAVGDGLLLEISKIEAKDVGE